MGKALLWLAGVFIGLATLGGVASCGESEVDRAIRESEETRQKVREAMQYHDIAKQVIEEYKGLRETLNTPTGAVDTRDLRHIEAIMRLEDHCSKIRDSHDVLLADSGFIETLDMLVEWLPHLEATIDAMTTEAASDSRCDETLGQATELKMRFLRAGGTISAD